MILWKLLLRFLTLGVDEPDPPTDDEDQDVNADAGGTGDESLDDLLDVVEPPAGQAPTGDAPAENAAVKEARRRAADLELQLEDERRARQAAEQRVPAPVSGADPETEREDAELAQARASGATPDQLSWLQWKIDSNRKIRASERASTGALREAQDVADRAAFDRLEVSKPQVYKRYAERVEKAMQEMRAKGQNAPRLAVLRLLIGDDIMNGKIKPKTVARPAPDAAAGTVDRGRSPGIRSDVRGKAGQNERDKRRARLENQLI
jgi:hypothetical protein